MKKNKLLVSFIIVTLIFFLVSCQPTPDNEIVSNKFENTIDIQNASVENKPTIEPIANQMPNFSEKIVKQSATSKGGLLNIDANVVDYPNDVIKIAKLEATTFSDAVVKNFVQYFSNGEPIYDSLSEGYWTKERIEDIMVGLKKTISSLQNGDNPYDVFRIGELEETIERMKLKYHDAPNLEDWKKKHIVNEVSDAELIRSEYILNPINDDFSFININNILDKNNPVPTIEYYNRDKTDAGSAFPRITNKQPFNISMTPEDVSHYVEDLLSSLKIDHMSIDSITVAKDFSDDDMEQFGKGDSHKIADVDKDDGAVRYYSVFLTRKYEGLDSPYVSNYEFSNNSVAADGKPLDYRSIWGPEYIRIDLDDTGVLYFLWSSPTRIQQEDTYSGNIIGIDEATDLFFKNASLLYSNRDSESLDLDISRIELGYYYEPVKDNLYEYLMIPAWFFFGVNNNKMSIDEYITDYSRAHVIVNAINGKLL